MAQEKLISFDLRSDQGFLKKPDYNEGMLLSYNMLHKPALLGILGAIVGLAGYQKKGELPAYFQQLQDIPVGIAPLHGYHEKGNFGKTSVKYSNTVGYANKDGNLLVEETMLLMPAYRCYLLLSLEDATQTKLYEYLKDGYAEFIPYLGKNEYPAWWLDAEGQSTFREYVFEKGSRTGEKLQIHTLFRKTLRLKEQAKQEAYGASYNYLDFAFAPETFAYFERLPAGFNQDLLQYELEEYTYSNFLLQADAELHDLYFLPELNGYVQLT